MKPSPGQVSSDQNWMHPKNGGSWSFAIAVVADTMGALDHTPSPKLSSHWQCSPKACSYSSCSLPFILGALSEAVGASHGEHADWGDHVLPPTSNYSKRQETVAQCPIPFCIPIAEISIMHLCVGFSSLLFTGIGSQITLCMQSLTENLLSGEPRPRQVSQSWWWQTKKYWQDLECAFPLMPKMLNK